MAALSIECGNLKFISRALAKKFFLKKFDSGLYRKSFEVLDFCDIETEILWECLSKLVIEDRFIQFQELLNHAKMDITWNGRFKKELLINATYHTANIQFVGLILEKKLCDINYQDDKGNTALHYAAELEPDEILNLLLENGANVEISNDEDMTALQVAVFSGEVQNYETLAKVTSDQTQKKNKSNDTLLHLAVLGQSEELVEKFITNVEFLNFQNSHGYTPLGLAASINNAIIVKKLLYKEYTSQVQCKISNTMLEECLKEGLKENYLLFDKYITINQKDKLMLALEGDNAELFEIVLNEDLKIVSEMSESHFKCYEIAVRRRNLQLCKILIKNGFNLNSSDSDKVTPLHLAAKYKYSEIFTLFVENGANLHALDKSYMTPICYATRSDKEYDIELLKILHVIGCLEITHNCRDNCVELWANLGEFTKTLIKLINKLFFILHLQKKKHGLIHLIHRMMTLMHRIKI